MYEGGHTSCQLAYTPEGLDPPSTARTSQQHVVSVGRQLNPRIMVCIVARGNYFLAYVR